MQALEVHIVLYYIKYILSRKIGCRPRADISRHIETTTAIFASYYSHSGNIISGNGALNASLPARNAAEGKSEASHGAHNATAEGVTAWRNDPSPQSSISSDSASESCKSCRCKGIVQHIGIGFPWLRCSHYQPAYGIVGHYVDSAGVPSDRCTNTLARLLIQS